MRNVVKVAPMIEWGVAAAPLAGETESGDLHLVKPVGRGMLVAAVDGLGHGAEAAAAARTAVATLDRPAGKVCLPPVGPLAVGLPGQSGGVLWFALLVGLQAAVALVAVRELVGRR